MAESESSSLDYETSRYRLLPLLPPYSVKFRPNPALAFSSCLVVQFYPHRHPQITSKLEPLTVASVASEVEG